MIAEEVSNSPVASNNDAPEHCLELGFRVVTKGVLLGLAVVREPDIGVVQEVLSEGREVVTKLQFILEGGGFQHQGSIAVGDGAVAGEDSCLGHAWDVPPGWVGEGSQQFSNGKDRVGIQDVEIPTERHSICLGNSIRLEACMKPSTELCHRT